MATLRFYAGSQEIACKDECSEADTFAVPGRSRVVEVLAPCTETLDVVKERELTGQRIAKVVSLMAERGVEAVEISFRERGAMEPYETHGSGFRKIATITPLQ